MKPIPGAALAALLMLAALMAGCATAGRYTGDEYYFTQDGVNWSCREPAPFKGGNCKPVSQWPNKGLSQ